MPAEIINLSERRNTPEKILPRYDAILVHGYWMTQKGKHTAPAMRTHFAARATALAWNGGRGAGKIVVDLGHLWGPKYPSEGKVLADTLTNKYHVPREAIILKEDAYSTYGEVKAGLELAKQNNWTKILDIAFSQHHMTIPGIYRSKELAGVGPSNLEVDCKSVESILQNDDNRIVDVRRRFSKRYSVPYFAYEALKWILMHRPGFTYQPLEEANKNARTKPINDFFWRIDKFRLPKRNEKESNVVEYPSRLKPQERAA